MTEIAAASVTPQGDPLVRVILVPVEVFGAESEDCPGCGEVVKTGYGLCDAVPGYSDCNRAIGHIYRVDEPEPEPWRQDGDTITIYVPQSELAKFGQRFGDLAADRCPNCHVPYTQVSADHQVSRPACNVVA